MFQKNFKEVMRATSLALVLSLAACGPVKFSSSTDSSSVDTTGTLREVHYNSTVSSTSDKLDIVLIVDDSNSMLADNQKLAANLSGFITKLQNSNIDWQMCATVTRALPVSSTQTAWGASIYWQNSATASYDLGMVLKKGTSNLSTIFTHTVNYIGAGWVGSDDERGIKAAYNHVYNGDYRYTPNNGCYRTNSAISYIIISDEDERSIAGDSSQQYYSNELKEMEDEDKPSVFISYVRDTFGSDRRFTVNSIIVKPGDSTCKASQDAGGAQSHYGFTYAELSNLTGGGIGSICASDYSTNMNLFFDKIQDSLSSIPLECSPYQGNITVTITPSTSITSRIEGMNLVFSSPVAAGSTVDLVYKCLDSRSPSSVASPTPVKSEGFFARIIAFFKNLF
ncbi:MAG: hypothetical protein AAGB31_04560 [Bdellovibrio sp.]